MIDLVENLAELVRGDATLDPAFAQPYTFESMTLYGWIESRAHTSIGTGEVREDFEIVFVYVTDGDGEEAVLQRDPDVSRKLDAWATAAMDELRQRGDFVMGDDGHLTYRLDADFLRQLETRGAALRISGWRILD